MSNSTFAESFDPAEYKEYEINFSFLSDDDTIDSFAIDHDGDSLGVEIDTTRFPVKTQGDKSVQFWLEVATAFKDAKAFNANNTVKVEVTITTEQGRVFRRTANVTFKRN